MVAQKTKKQQKPIEPEELRDENEAASGEHEEPREWISGDTSNCPFLSIGCPNCNATGTVGEDGQCPTCNGSGQISKSAESGMPDRPEEKIVPGALPDQAEAMEKIQDAEAVVTSAEWEMDGYAEKHKSAKKAFELAVEKLRSVIVWARTPQVADTPTLFDEIPARGERAKSAAQEKIENCWRDFPLSRFTEFGLTASLINLLAEHSPPMTTMGQFADFTKPQGNGYTPKFTDVKGIGKGKVQALEDAGIAFWAKWPSMRDAFAKEQGLINETPEATDGESAAADWSEPAPSDRAEA